MRYKCSQDAACIAGFQCLLLNLQIAVECMKSFISYFQRVLLKLQTAVKFMKSVVSCVCTFLQSHVQAHTGSHIEACVHKDSHTEEKLPDLQMNVIYGSR